MRVSGLCRVVLSSVRFLALAFAFVTVALVNGCGGATGSAPAGGSSSASAPSVSSISPATLKAGSSAVTLTVTGTGFLQTSIIQVGTTAETTTYISSTQLSATVPAAQLTTGAQLAVGVSNGSTAAEAARPINLEVDNPTPVIGSVAPASEIVGATAAVITVTGTGFVPATVINVNGSARTTTFISSTQVSVALAADDVAAATSLSLTAVNPAPAGGTSAAATVAVTMANPAPAITSISPSSELVGASSPVIAVTGTGFTSSTVIDVNGTPHTTTLVGATQVSFRLSAADVTSAGSRAITAVNPAPGGGNSAAVPFTINNPPIGNIQLSPASLRAGGTTPAVITVTGDRFVTSSVVQVNGVARTTTYVNGNTLTFAATVADQASGATLSVTVLNPAPGGGTSAAATLSVLQAGLSISTVLPNSFIARSSDTSISVQGIGFTTQSVVEWNGAALSTRWASDFLLYAVVPAADLIATGTAGVTVNTPGANPSLSNSVAVTITNAPPVTLSSISPNAGPINTPAAITLSGSGFTADSTVNLDGSPIATTFVSSNQLTVNLPAATFAIPGNSGFTVTTSGSGGGTSAEQVYTAYIQMPNNDMAYNPADGLLYVSVPASSVGVGGNSIIAMDPTTGNIVRQIWVGSNPNKLAISTDGSQIFVGLDGAAAVAQVDLSKGKVVNQFSLGGGEGVYNPPYTAEYLAAVPGLPNSVAVAVAGSFSGGAGVTIFDSGVARAKSSSGVSYGPLSFGSPASTLYMANSSNSQSAIEQLSVDATGISAAVGVGSNLSSAVTDMQYDNGRLYLNTGGVLSASNGGLFGSFYSTATDVASGPIVSDSTLGRAFIAETSFSYANSLLVFDESTFNQVGSIPVNGVGVVGYSTTFRKLVRWGQNGLAVNTYRTSFADTSQIFIFQSPLVKDVSSSPADLSVSLTAPANATTGAAVSWVATVKNLGPNIGQGTALVMNLDPSLTINSVTASQGTCGAGAAFACDLGNLASGASATVTVSAILGTSGTVEGTANVSSTSYDPVLANDQATSTTTVTGGLYGATPSVSAISPNLVQAGTSDFTLTVTGAGFNPSSTVYLDAMALGTTYVSGTQLTATVSATAIANYGYALVTVSNPLPGGGLSPMLPLTIYGLVNVPASALVFDPYAQLLWATIPSTATNLTGNTVVSIDPVTSKVGTPIPVGSEPNTMAETSNGNYLYVGLGGADSLARFDLLHQSLINTIPLTLTSGGATNSVAATSLVAMPGSDTTLGIGTASTWNLFGIFDLSGSTGSFRPNLSAIYSGVNPVFADPSHVYAFDSETSAAEFYRYNVDANGLTLVDGTTLNGLGQLSGGSQLPSSLVYGYGGGIVNPLTTPPSQVATMTAPDFYQAGISTRGVGIAADPSLQKEFLMAENDAGTLAWALTRYNLDTYLGEGLLVMPSTLRSASGYWTMLRWGQDGLALLVSSQDYVSGHSTASIMLLRGPFVAPQILSASSAASLSSSSLSKLGHGSGNTILTLTGANLQAGIAVTWNGSYRTTTIVDATHITVAIPASDLANAGTATLVATNPGASSSNGLQITIQ
jgi:trimeric autotransporter adhesin